jgi:hypothetical protein
VCNRIREYCDAIEGRHADHAQTDESARAWLTYARQRADRLQRLPQMPEDPKLRAEDLTPFLPRCMSPYSPQEGSRWRAV